MTLEELTVTLKMMGLECKLSDDKDQIYVTSKDPLTEVELLVNKFAPNLYYKSVINLYDQKWSIIRERQNDDI
jgi:hypothetical protein